MSNEIIYKRKSIRKYHPDKLDAAMLDKVRAQIDKLVPLYPSIQYSVEIADNARGIFGIKAPHYLCFYSEEKEGFNENIGFVGQQMDLFLSGIGLGAVWLGMSKPDGKSSQTPESAYAGQGLSFIIAIGFGKPAEPLYRDVSEFKRKPLDEISEGIDKRLEAARLAPSGMNTQGWYFVADDGKIHCYRKKTKLLVGLFAGDMGAIDMGIALCHIAEQSDEFRFAKEVNIPERKGYIYSGTVQSR